VDLKFVDSLEAKPDRTGSKRQRAEIKKQTDETREALAEQSRGSESST
jgi:hypothetical protein